MAIHASPGVYFEILDFSLYAPRLSKTILALVGKAEKGPTEPTFISSVRQFIDTFGVPRKTDYSSLAAISYLEFGSALWFSRLIGSDAKKAEVTIPKALEVSDEVIGTATSRGDYIFNGTLNYIPVPGTVEIVIYDPLSPENKIVITDDEAGNFSPYTNLSVSNFSNFIDYDTGEYRFTLNSVQANDTISIVYNTKDTNRVSENHSNDFEPVFGTDNFSGMLTYGNILNNDSLRLVVQAGTNVYTMVSDDTTNLIVDEITGELLDSSLVQVGTVTIDTSSGTVLISFIDTAPESIIVTSTYTNRTAKTKLLGSVGTGDSLKTAFIGTLNSVILPETVEIVLTSGGISTTICTDNGNGRFIDDDLVISTNSVNYTTGDISFSLIVPPKTGNVIKANYLAKFNTSIFDAVSETAPGNISAQLSMVPVLKNSIIIKVGERTFTDDGEGFITGTNGNGSIDYDTGYIDFNHAFTINPGESVRVNWLSVFGKVKSLYEGSIYDNTTVEFYKDPYYGYGVKVWNPNQTINQVPEENWKDINFTDPNSTRYFMSKVSSRLIEFEIDDSSDSVPLLNSKLILVGGDSDDSNINEASAITALEQFSNVESYDINLIACPDYPGEKTVINKLIQVCEVQRGDCFALIDPLQNLTVQQAVEWHNGDGQWSNENSINSSYAAIYYPWVQIYNQFTESLQWVPPSVKIVSVYAYSDSVSEVWFAPAGLNRGRLFTTEKVERQLNLNDRDYLYSTQTNCINPICDFVGDGIVVYGQKTAQRKPSATDRVNVMRLLLYMKKILATAVKYLLFEPNDEITWILYRQLVEPFVDDIRRRRGLYEFKIVCDETTTTPYDIDNNTMVGEIWLKPTKTAERIINRFILTSTGASFEELQEARS